MAADIRFIMITKPQSVAWQRLTMKPYCQPQRMLSPLQAHSKTVLVPTPTQALQGLTAPGHILFIGEKVCTRKHGAHDLAYRPAKYLGKKVWLDA